MQNQIDEEIGEVDELGQFRRRQRRSAFVAGDSLGARRIQRMPYDYIARFLLNGRPGHRVVSVINISAEAWFICTSLGYSLEEPPVIEITAAQPSPASPGEILRSRGLALTRFDRRLNLAAFVKTLDGSNAPQAIQGAIEAEQLNSLQTQNIRDSLSFKYAIIDKGSGRELQNEPIHNIAGLGKPDGVRPFRELVVPYVFAPNSSILIEIEEILTLAGGTINLDFQGYKEYR